ncbi:MAG: hypothetical protein MJ252_19295 [archaeon]|nr:hypothetical protein [archaeon]
MIDSEGLDYLEETPEKMNNLTKAELKRRLMNMGMSLDQDDHPLEYYRKMYEDTNKKENKLTRNRVYFAPGEYSEKKRPREKTSTAKNKLNGEQNNEDWQSESDEEMAAEKEKRRKIRKTDNKRNGGVSHKKDNLEEGHFDKETKKKNLGITERNPKNIRSPTYQKAVKKIAMTSIDPKHEIRHIYFIDRNSSKGKAKDNLHFQTEPNQINNEWKKEEQEAVQRSMPKDFNEPSAYENIKHNIIYNIKSPEKIKEKIIIKNPSNEGISPLTASIRSVKKGEIKNAQFVNSDPQKVKKNLTEDIYGSYPNETQNEGNILKLSHIEGMPKKAASEETQKVKLSQKAFAEDFSNEPNSYKNIISRIGKGVSKNLKGNENPQDKDVLPEDYFDKNPKEKIQNKTEMTPKTKKIQSDITDYFNLQHLKKAGLPPQEEERHLKDGDIRNYFAETPKSADIRNYFPKSPNKPLNEGQKGSPVNLPYPGYQSSLFPKNLYQTLNTNSSIFNHKPNYDMTLPRNYNPGMNLVPPENPQHQPAETHEENPYRSIRTNNSEYPQENINDEEEEENQNENYEGINQEENQNEEEIPQIGQNIPQVDPQNIPEPPALLVEDQIRTEGQNPNIPKTEEEFKTKLKAFFKPLKKIPKYIEPLFDSPEPSVMGDIPREKQGIDPRIKNSFVFLGFLVFFAFVLLTLYNCSPYQALHSFQRTPFLIALIPAAFLAVLAMLKLKSLKNKRKLHNYYKSIALKDFEALKELMTKIKANPQQSFGVHPGGVGGVLAPIFIEERAALNNMSVEDYSKNVFPILQNKIKNYKGKEIITDIYNE